MKRRVALGIALAFAIPSTYAAAADLPAIKVTGSNPVPACTTPGRLMAFIRSRNASVEPRLEKIAVEYMKRGEELGLRWDYAFFQMAIETSYLTYRRDGGKRGDVKPAQNNFAGLGATGRGEPGESFADMATGVLAHLQHVAVYAGDEVANPVADRTRKIIQWGIGEAIKKKAKGPVTYSDLARRWATGNDYADAIETHARIFYRDFCNKADPEPELVAEARGETAAKKQSVAAAPAADQPERVSGAALARRAIEDGKAEEINRSTGLGAGSVPKMPEPASEPEAQPKRTSPTYSVLNAPKPDAPARIEKPERAEPVEKAEKAEKPARTEKAEKPAEKPPVQNASFPKLPGTKCRVFTASYGGQKAVIIRAQADGGLNYTVLDVNEGSEKREADAYIAAYARGGAIAGEFGSQTQALDKAFELCPEG